MKHKTIIALTSILCVLPVILSLVLYDQLPNEIVVQWNSAGEANRYMSKSVAAFGLPAFFLIFNLFSKIRLLYDPKYQNHSTVIRLISIWTIPFLSLTMVPITLFMSLGVDIPIITITTLIVGTIFIVLGNYLPKVRQNYVMGIKLPWTLDNVENWNKTNRLTGYIMIIGGIAILASGFVPTIGKWANTSLMLLIAAIIIVIPLIYSYRLYQKEQAINSKIE